MAKPTQPLDAELTAFAHELADAAAEAVLPYFRIPIAVDNKAAADQFDPVTAADRAAEQAILARVAAVYPEHGVIGEEFGVQRPEARYQWVVDPIDGTRAFISGSPLWGTLIALSENGRPRIGVMDQPFTGERFWSDGEDTFARWPGSEAKRIATRACPGLGAATLMTTDPNLFEPGEERWRFEGVRRQVRMTRFGGDCYAYCLVAAGFVDLVIESGLQPHDVMALIPIIEHAGGCFTTWDGGPASAGGRIIASGDPALHEEVVKLLSAAP